MISVLTITSMFVLGINSNHSFSLFWYLNIFHLKSKSGRLKPLVSIIHVSPIKSGVNTMSWLLLLFILSKAPFPIRSITVLFVWKAGNSWKVFCSSNCIPALERASAAKRSSPFRIIVSFVFSEIAAECVWCWPPGYPCIAVTAGCRPDEVWCQRRVLLLRHYYQNW